MLENFKDPGAVYRPIPFWSWNDELHTDEIVRQIDEMKNAGLGGYFMHARGGLKTQYLSEKWFNCIEKGIKKGEESQMGAWIYDEEGWPSGFAGGIVTDMSTEYHARYIVIHEYTDCSNIDWDNTLAVYSCIENEAPVRVSCNISSANGGRLLVVYKKIQRYYIDVMNKEAVDAFISVTHQRYYEKLGSSFGKTMQGFFTDEPRFACNNIGCLAWSDTMPEEFFKRYNYSILDHLPLLWFEFDGYEKVRYDYWRAVNDLFVSSFMKNIFDWCEAHKCLLTGHIMMEESIFSQMSSTAGVMPFYEYEHIPGIDWLRRRIESPVIGKQVGSVACQLGRKHVITESFALTGWNVSFEELKWIMEWQYVNGVNLLCQHLEAYSIKGSRKRDYPPSLFIQQSWWSEYKAFNDYAARLGVVLSSGKAKANILVLHPMRSGFLCFDGTRTEKMRRLDKCFEELSVTLSSNQIDYHYGDETIISKFGSVREDCFVVGEMSYKAVIMPHMYSIDAATLTLLNEFAHNGGAVFSIGSFPEYTNCEADKLKLLKGYVRKTTLENIRNELDSLGMISVDIVTNSISTPQVQSGVPDSGDLLQNGISIPQVQSGDISLQQRETESGLVLFMVNHSQDNTYSCNITVHSGEYTVRLLHAEDGSEEMLESFSCGGKTSFPLSFEPMQSHIVLLNDRADIEHEHAECDYIGIPPGDWEVKEMGLNSLTLDMCSYRVDGDQWLGPVPPIKLQKNLLDLKRPCDIEMRFDFEVDMNLSCNREFYAVIEDAEVYTVTVNGNNVNCSKDNWWKDKAFNKINIKPYIKNGKNEILLKTVFSQNKKVYDTLYGIDVYETELNKLTYDIELESIYLAGDFSVYSRSEFENAERSAMLTDGPFVIKDKPVSFSGNSLTQQGLLFFAEDILITKKFSIRKQEGKKLILKFGKQQSPIIKIYLNGILIKTSLWAPYHADITEAALDGENYLEIRLFASNRNLLGPHHYIKGESYSVGPSSFTGEWSWVERESEDDCTDKNRKNSSYWCDSYCFMDFGLK